MRRSAYLGHFRTTLFRKLSAYVTRRLEIKWCKRKRPQCYACSTYDFLFRKNTVTSHYLVGSRIFLILQWFRYCSTQKTPHSCKLRRLLLYRYEKVLKSLFFAQSKKPSSSSYMQNTWIVHKYGDGGNSTTAYPVL